MGDLVGWFARALREGFEREAPNRVSSASEDWRLEVSTGARTFRLMGSSQARLEITQNPGTIQHQDAGRNAESNAKTIATTAGGAMTENRARAPMPAPEAA